MFEFTLRTSHGLVRAGLATLALLALILTAGTSIAATWTVGGDGGPRSLATIAAAVEESAGGDTILIMPGTYHETVAAAKALTVVGNGGPGAVVLDGGELHTALAFSNISGQVVLDRLEFYRGWSGQGGGARFESVTGGAIIRDCTFRDCHGEIGGGGLDIYDTQATITGCAFINNGAEGVGTTSGGGVNFRDFCAGSVVENAVFKQNHADKGGALQFYGGITVRNCTFEDNWGTDGGAIYLSGGGPSVTGCSFHNNTAADRGGAIFGSSGSGGLLSFCSFDQNNAANGGGVYIIAGISVVENCTFSLNAASGQGPALLVKPTALSIRRCIFTEHAGAAPVCAEQAAITFVCNDFYDNAGGMTEGVESPFGVEGNFEADPQFCGEKDLSGAVEDGNFEIDSGSACAPGGRESLYSLAIVGSGPVGCGTTQILESSWGRVKSSYQQKR